MIDLDLVLDLEGPAGKLEAQLRFANHFARAAHRPIIHGDRKADGDTEARYLTFKRGDEEAAEFQLVPGLLNSKADHNDGGPMERAELDGYSSAILESNVKLCAAWIRTACKHKVSATTVGCEGNEKWRLRRSEANFYGSLVPVEWHFAVRIESQAKYGEVAELDVAERQAIPCYQTRAVISGNDVRTVQGAGRLQLRRMGRHFAPESTLQVPSGRLRFRLSSLPKGRPKNAGCCRCRQ